MKVKCWMYNGITLIFGIRTDILDGCNKRWHYHALRAMSPDVIAMDGDISDVVANLKV